MVLRITLLMTVTTATALAQDTDADGINDVSDNCITVSNNLQEDTDGDGYGDACAHPTAQIGAVARFEAAYVGARAVIEDGADIGPGAIVGRRAHVGAGAVLGAGAILGRSAEVDAGSSVGADTTVGYASKVLGSSVGAQSTVGNLVSVRDGSDLGGLVVVARDSLVRGADLDGGVIVGPEADIAPGAHLFPNVRVRKQVDIHANAQVHDGARIGRNSEIGTGADVGVSAVVAANVRLHAGQTVAANGRVERGTVVGTPVVRSITIDGNHTDFGDPICNGLDGTLYASTDADTLYVAMTDLALRVNSNGPFFSVVVRNGDFPAPTATTYGPFDFTGANAWDYGVSLYGQHDGFSDVYYSANNGSGSQQGTNPLFAHHHGYDINQVSELAIPLAWLGSSAGDSTIEIGVFAYDYIGGVPTVHRMCGYTGAPYDLPVGVNEFAGWVTLPIPTYLP